MNWISRWLDRWAWSRACGGDLFYSDGDKLSEIQKATHLKKLVTTEGWPLLKGLLTHQLVRVVGLAEATPQRSVGDLGLAKGIAFALTCLRKIEDYDLDQMMRDTVEKAEDKKQVRREGGQIDHGED